MRTIRTAGSWLVVFALTGCTSIVTRSYELPVDQVSLAAREAAISVGYPGAGLSEQRALLFGFFLGDGGETIQIDIVPAGSRTDVTITSRKQPAGFLAQQHYASMVAEYMDAFVRENQPLWQRAASQP